MNIFEIVMLSVALAVDAMLVCFSYGVTVLKNRIQVSIKMAFSFGLFQFIMPVIGWKLSEYVYNYLQIYSKWIVFIVFLFLGLKFLKEAFIKKEEIKECDLSYTCLFSLAIATSIDAMGAGISIKFLNAYVLKPSLFIGVITFFLSLCGFWMAVILKKLNSKFIELFGAMLLIYLAIKSLI